MKSDMAINQLNGVGLKKEGKAADMTPDESEQLLKEIEAKKKRLAVEEHQKYVEKVAARQEEERLRMEAEATAQADKLAAEAEAARLLQE